MVSSISSAVAEARTAVITRTKDRPLLLHRAMESVLSQSDSDWVHVVVNDGGDESALRSVLDLYRDRYAGRLYAVHNAKSVGMEAASGIGINASKSEFVLIHDDDDSLEPQFLEKTTRYLRDAPSESIQGVATLAMLVQERIEGDRVVPEKRRIFRHLKPLVLAAEVARSNPIPPISFLLRRTALDSVGGFNEALPVLGDWEFLLRFLDRFDVGVIPEPLANYHVRLNGSGHHANSVVGDIQRHQLFENVVRNKLMRDLGPALGVLVQQGAAEESSRRKLEALLSHPILGRVIRIWSRLINSNVPHES